MRKSIGKVIALMIVWAIVVQLLPVNAQPFKQGRVVVNHFDTFAGYVSVSEDEKYPEGWERGVDVKDKSKKFSIIDTETGSTCLSVGSQGRIVFPFEEVISKGKIRVSFDMKTLRDKTSVGDMNFSSHVAIDEEDINVRYYNYSGSGSWNDKRMTYFINTSNDGFSDTEIVRGGSEKQLGDSESKVFFNGERTGTNGAWHKYELLIDLDAEIPMVYGYVDSSLVYKCATMDNVREIKDFFFRKSTANTCYIDNFYVNHFFENSHNNAMITLDSEAEEGTVNMVFSTAINNSITVDDFVITSSDGEMVGNPSSVEVLPNSTVRLTMTELESGLYSIACVGGSVTKSGEIPLNQVTYNVGVETPDEPIFPENDTISISDFRLYKFVANSKYANKFSIPGGLYPARISSLTQRDLAEYKAVIKGYNPGASAELYVILASYNISDEYIIEAIPLNVTAETGEFTISVDLSQLIKLRETGEGIVKAFLWNKDTCAPLMESFEYDWVSPLAD